MKNFGIIILLLLLIPYLDSCRNKGPESPIDKTSVADLMASMNIQPVTRPTESPDFKLISVTGKSVSLKGYRGKVVLLSFWTTW